VEAHRVLSDQVQVFGRPWEEGTDICLRAGYHYGDLEGWLRSSGWRAAGEISGSAEFIGSDYSYARADLELIKAFTMPWSGGLVLRGRVFWTDGDAPLQAGYLPGVNLGFRNAGNTISPGDRGVLMGAEIRQSLLGSLPIHPSIPLVGRVFYDVSYAWADEVNIGDISFADYWRSWGLGIEYAVFHLDVAFPVEGRIRDRSRVYLNMIGIDQVMLGARGER
jgi:hypothetical protein